MSTSASERQSMGKIGFAYLVLAALTALFGGVYEAFSHGVYAYRMLYAFLVPLVGGALPFAALSLCAVPCPGRGARGAYHAGLATLTVGCIFQGALDIYGTSNSLTGVYWAAGAVLTGLGLAWYLAGAAGGRREARP